MDSIKGKTAALRAKIRARNAKSKTVHLKQATGCVGATATHPRHKGDDVVFLVFDGIFGVLLFTLLRAAEPNCPCLQLLLPPTYMSQTVTAAYKRRCQYD